jgi:hypothetical protein
MNENYDENLKNLKNLTTLSQKKNIQGTFQMSKNLRILFPNLGILVMLLQKACEEFAQCMKIWGTTLNMKNLATLP